MHPPPIFLAVHPAIRALTNLFILKKFNCNVVKFTGFENRKLFNLVIHQQEIRLMEVFFLHSYFWQ